MVREPNRRRNKILEVRNRGLTTTSEAPFLTCLRFSQPTYLRASKSAGQVEAADVVLFSGGKDSFLAVLEAIKELKVGSLRQNRPPPCCSVGHRGGPNGGCILLGFNAPSSCWQASGRRDKAVVLLTTYDPDMGMHGLQQASVKGSEVTPVSRSC